MFSYTETSLQKLMVSLICKLEVGSDNKEQWSGHRQVLRKLKLCSMKCLVLLFCNVSIAQKISFLFTGFWWPSFAGSQVISCWKVIRDKHVYIRQKTVKATAPVINRRVHLKRSPFLLETFLKHKSWPLTFPRINFFFTWFPLKFFRSWQGQKNFVWNKTFTFTGTHLRVCWFAL